MIGSIMGKLTNEESWVTSYNSIPIDENLKTRQMYLDFAILLYSYGVNAVVAWGRNFMPREPAPELQETSVTLPVGESCGHPQETEIFRFLYPLHLHGFD